VSPYGGPRNLVKGCLSRLKDSVPFSFPPEVLLLERPQLGSGVLSSASPENVPPDYIAESAKCFLRGCGRMVVCPSS